MYTAALRNKDTVDSTNIKRKRTIVNAQLTYLNHRAVQRFHRVHEIHSVLLHSFLAVHCNPLSLVLTVQHGLVLVLKPIPSCEMQSENKKEGLH